MKRMGAHDKQAERIAEAILFLALALPLGLFDPKLDVPAFIWQQSAGFKTTIDASTSSNLINQLEWATLGALGSWALLSAPNRFARMINFAWPILLLFAVCLLSILWSDHPDIAARRALGLILSAFSLLAGVTYVGRLERVALICYLAFWCMLIVTVAVLALPAFYDEFGYLRGVTDNKNTLGAICGLAIIIGLNAGRWRRHRSTDSLRVIYLVAWASVIVLTVSKTSIGLAVLVPVAFFAFKTTSQVVRLNFSITLLAILTLFLTGLGLSYCAASYTPTDLIQLVIPDASFTGRTPIWMFITQHISERWLTGYGFGSFWSIGYSAPNLESLYEYIRVLNQGHNGYLDILVTLGILGIVALLIVVLHFGSAAEALYHSDRALFRIVWMLMLFALLHNAMESSLLVPFHPVWQFTLLALFISVRATAEPEFKRKCAH
jgi:O-antigen ligase